MCIRDRLLQFLDALLQHLLVELDDGIEEFGAQRGVLARQFQCGQFLQRAGFVAFGEVFQQRAGADFRTCLLYTSRCV